MIKSKRFAAFLFIAATLGLNAHAADYASTLKAANEGNAEAQFDMGTMYDVGEQGVKRDLVEAAKWYRMAAEQGDSAAQYNLAIMYDMGEGVEKDLVQAYAWISVSEIFGNKGARESSKQFAARMNKKQLEDGDALIMKTVNRITKAKVAKQADPLLAQ